MPYLLIFQGLLIMRTPQITMVKKMENKKQKLELTWIGKDEVLRLEPMILIHTRDCHLILSTNSNLNVVLCPWL